MKDTLKNRNYFMEQMYKGITKAVNKCLQEEDYERASVLESLSDALEDLCNSDDFGRLMAEYNKFTVSMAEELVRNMACNYEEEGYWRLPVNGWY